MTWKPIETAPIGEIVWTKIHDDEGERNIARLRSDGHLWWLPDDSMYVYYAPTHWQRSDRRPLPVPA